MSHPSHSLRLMLQSAGVATLMALPSAFAHETGHPHSDEVTETTPLPFITETKGPVSAPRQGAAPGEATSGQGVWRFVADRSKVPVPPDAMPKLKGAHGTLIVDGANDTVYWGLQDIGWIGFTKKLTESAIVPQDPAFPAGNLHGADIHPRRGKPAAIVAADNAAGEVYLTDTTFQSTKILKIPNLEQYADGKGYAPTDAAFGKDGTIWVTDGYGKAWFMPVSPDTFQFQGKAYGGKKFSGTPHGITLNPKTGRLLVSARPEGLVKDWDPKNMQTVAIDGLPPGSTVCDVDVWGDYALAPCLNGPDKTPGPIYIINLKKKAVVSTLKPKTDLGYEDAQHIHDACWYVTGSGRNREVYVLYTNWNPGGVGALRWVGAAE
ncbi:MAG: hypothetical protein AB7O66_08865 [Limisphaerales bacterium]